MKIGLLNFEPKYKNLALEKIKIYHESKGDTVSDFALGFFDKVYCSSLFDFTDKNGRIPPSAICGGTGFDMTTTLPKEIESIEPHLNFGFTTRGCIRHCKFCVVPQKEGEIRVVGDLMSLWDRESRDIVLYDNNILAMPEHFAMICEQSRKYNLRLDFNQGLDHRLLTTEIVDLLKLISHHEYRFAFDHPSLLHSVDSAIKLLQAKGINRCNWYVLVGFDTILQEDLLRLNFLRDHNQIAYVQRYKGKKKLGKEYTALARWSNQHHIFRGMTWQQFLEHPDNGSYRYLLNYMEE